jgi:hypothetical protein
MRHQAADIGCSRSRGLASLKLGAYAANHYIDTSAH